MIDINKLKLTDMGNPELIPQLVEEMNTKFIKEEEKIIIEKLFDLNIDKDILINQVQEINRLNDILREYKELEEQGLLLKLPCKVGDTVYIIDKRYTKCSLYDEEYSESSCWNCDKECDSKMYYVVVKRYVGTLEWVVSRLKNFGKTVFLTKEEAEKELERLENEQCKE